MSLKVDFANVVKDIADSKKDIGEIKSDISDIKEDLAMHIKRTAILEGRTDIFEQEMRLFRDSAKNIETSSLIIQKVWKPFLILVAVASSSIAFPNLAAAIQQIIGMF